MLQDMHIGLTQLDQASWIVTGYLLGYVCVLPLMGRLSDVYGRRLVYLASLAMFVAGSVACATAQNLEWLVAARVVQALGGGALLPVAYALVADALEGSRRALWLGGVGAAAEAGGVLGPVYGATIVQHWGWRVIFWANVPLSLAIGLGLFAAGVQRAHTRQSASVDYIGALLFAAAVCALTVGVSGSSDPTSSASPIRLERAVPLSLAALLAFALFFWRQNRTADPLVPPTLFRLRMFAAANAVNALVGVALIAAMVDVPLFAATVLGRSPTEAGLALLRLTVCIPIGAIAGGWLAGKLPWNVVAIAGLLVSSSGFWLMSKWTLTISEGAATSGLVLAGLGFGLVIAPVTAAVLAPVSADRALSTALLTVMRMVGMTVGLAALTSVAFFRFKQLVSQVVLPLPVAGETPEALSQRFAEYQAGVTNAALEVFTGVFAIAAGICLANCLLVLALGSGREATNSQHAA